ncbi:AAA family ATPase [Acidobacteriota bacterium]
MASRDIKDFISGVLAQIETEMFGLTEIIKLSLVALYTGGHVLLEGNPGLGKTELVKKMGKVLDLPFRRIQFTPDLLPSDITGTYVPDFKGDAPTRLAFQPGPIFTSLLLADEINRATPKTQSAMLEAMGERQVTVLGERYELQTPFMVLATQNPIDHEGTYALPAAQSDRFLFKITMPVPDVDTLGRILRKTAGEGADGGEKDIKEESSRPLPKAPKDIFMIIHERIKKVKPLPSLERHILNMILASNRRFNDLEGLDRNQAKRLEDLVNGLMTYGLGPRAATALMLGAKAWSLMFLPSAENAEGPGLARVVLPALRHRVSLHFGWKSTYLKMTDKKQDLREDSPQDGLLEQMVMDFCLAAAPRTKPYTLEYGHTVEGPLRKVVELSQKSS